MSLIWATRGRNWGHRFLLDGGFEDPLELYDRAFSSVGGETNVCERIDGTVALRFPDPDGRRDRAGRPISHEFVVLEPLAPRIHTLKDGIRLVWNQPGIADRYAKIWDQPQLPTQA